MMIRPPLGWWQPDHGQSAPGVGTGPKPDNEASAIRDALRDLRSSTIIVRTEHGPAVASSGTIQLDAPSNTDSWPVLAVLPPLPPESLGDRAFLSDHRIRYPYMTGAMANGIASVEVVVAAARSGMLGSFGAAGLSVERVDAAIGRLQHELGELPFCVNLIHSPNEPTHEAAVADLLLRRGVKLVEASAYLDLTPAIVRYRVAGVAVGSDGRIHSENRVIAKVSRTEVATRFLSPPPERILRELVATGQLTAKQAALAAALPMCDDLTAEADSGGHTDNRPAITLLPTMLALRDRLHKQYLFSRQPRVGLAGGIATPASVAGAFALGAAYVVTGSINQACVESGSSDAVRKMLGEAGQADVTMAPAADMFEMGVKVQVLKRGTMFPMRAAKLYEIFRQYPNWEAIPAADRAQVEKTILRRPFEAIWDETRAFFARRDPSQVEKGDNDARHRMALVFRWYLGLSSRWANLGEADRQLDYQVWCGPAMGAFNEWSRGSHLAEPGQRCVARVAANLLYGAALHLRQVSLRQCGIGINEDWLPTGPLTDDELAAHMELTPASDQ